MTCFTAFHDSYEGIVLQAAEKLKNARITVNASITANASITVEERRFSAA